MQTMINLGIWENKNYHFDWEEKNLTRRDIFS